MTCETKELAIFQDELLHRVIITRLRTGGAALKDEHPGVYQSPELLELTLGVLRSDRT